MARRRSNDEIRQDRLFEIALQEEWIGQRSALRAIYHLVRKQGWSPKGVRHNLEDTLKYVNRMILADNIMIGKENK